MNGNKLVVDKEPWIDIWSMVAVGLSALTEVQAVVSAPIPGALDGSRETLVAYSYQLVEEIHETLREVGVKPWKQPTTPDLERVIEEYADILAFLGIVTINLAKICDVPIEEFTELVARQYEDTSQKNAGRFREGREVTR